MAIDLVRIDLVKGSRIKQLAASHAQRCGGEKAGSYMKLDEEMKIKIGKYSSENGVSAAARAARHF